LQFHKTDPLALVKEFIEEIWNKKNVSLLDKYIQPAYTIFLDNTDPWKGKTIDLDTFIARLQNSFLPFPDTISILKLLCLMEMLLL
jgi:hypothetical protein